MNSQLKARWEKGKNNTLRHYTRKLAWKARDFNRELYLPDYFGPMIGAKKEVTIAELGSGMFCTIGSLWKTAKVKVYPSDALANHYGQILKGGGVTPLIPVEKQDMERLSYGDNFFDIVHCVNALDHTTDPVKALKEMYRVLKPGGFIYLRHFPNVGEHEKYAGLHIWNIDLDVDNTCIIWNKEHRFPLSEIISGFVNSIQEELGSKVIVSILRKI